MKKSSFFIGVFILNSSILFSQVGVNIDGTLPDSSAMLDVKSTTRGFLPPRMTKMELSAIINPADGLIVYCTNCSEDGQGMMAIFMNGAWQMVGTNCKIEKPTEGTHVPGQWQIEWKWHPVAYATSYKWNTTNDYGTAVDVNYDTSRTETGLICNTIYTRYVWASNDCISSTPLTMTGTTGNCFDLPCGQPMTVNHIAADVAPVSETILYNTVGEIPGEPGKCWITQNLGAEHEADTVIDDTEASAGWYWQFNRKQGYKHDGTTRTPNTTWITAIDENSEWQISQDPCNKELGPEWRIPSYTEWFNIDNAGGWTTWYGPWGSDLKLHAAGCLYNNNGSMDWRGVYGYYWSSTQSSATNGWLFSIYIGHSQFLSGNKAFGYPLRCLKDTCGIAPPAPGVHTFTETGITWTWEPVTGATGYKWNTTGDPASAIDVGTDTAITETGLICNTSYNRYVWAYNACGTSSPADLSQTTSACSFVCGTSTITLNHVAGDVAPVTKTVTYGTVTNVPGETTKCWITQNLGSDRQALSVDDATEESAGWYWQFSLKKGYKYDTTGRIPYTSWSAVYGQTDWQTADDPCNLELGGGWRIPTHTEWVNVSSSGGWTNWYGPWNSALKLHAAGQIESSGEWLESRGEWGYYWSSTYQNVLYGWSLDFWSVSLYNHTHNKASGFNLRCIKSCIPPASPEPGNHMPSSSQIHWKWDPVPGVYGYKWNDTCDFTTAIDVGNATAFTETGLTCNTDCQRFVWAYVPCGCSQVLALNSTTTPDLLPAPTEGNHVIGPTEIVWKWDAVPGASGYKWNTIYNYDAAIDLGTSTSKSQTGLTCMTSYSSLVWAYGECGKSGHTYLEATTAMDPPQIPTAGTHIPKTKKIEWKWNTVPGATNYAWSSVNDYNNYDYMWMGYDSFTSHIDSGLIPDHTYTSYVWAINDCGHADPVTLTQATDLNPGPPTAGDHTEGSTLIIWKWNLDPEAEYSRWNTTSDYATSVWAVNQHKQTGLNPSITYTSFVWDCNVNGGHSEAVPLTATTLPQYNCGMDTLIINHNTSGGVAPVNRTVVYRTVDSLPGEPDLCWITHNLGAIKQADSLNDTTEAYRGWFWQFNRKQGYPQTSLPFPSWVISNEEPNWQTENDPCRLELGSPWRIPTKQEWSDVRAWGGWTDGYGPWNSALKLHMAGAIMNAYNLRDPDGWYWSSFNDVNGWALWIRINSCVMNPHLNYHASSLRCVREL